MSSNFINITFPFKNSDVGFFINLNKTNKDSIKSNLMHILLTKKGERYMNPDFGTNLLRFLFEPTDNITLVNIKDELREVVTKYLPNITINDLEVEENTNNNYSFRVILSYRINNIGGGSPDNVIINI